MTQHSGAVTEGTDPSRVRRLPAASAMVAVLVLAAGCGGGSSADGGGSTPPPTTTSTSPSAPPAGTSAQQIRQAWISFFKGSTPAAAKIPLLQRGSSVAAVINAQAGNSLATGTAANVSAITVTSSRRATVHYTITIDGKPALAHQSGLAVKVGGHWLVSLDSFCALLALEGTHPAACPNPGPTAGP